MPIIEQARSILDLSKLQLPAVPKVVGIETEEFVDWTGDDALRIWVLIDESTDVERLSGRSIIDLKAALHRALLNNGITLFPYISLVKPSELAEAAEDEEE